MARFFDGTDDRINFSAGALAGVHAWGLVAVLIKRASAGGSSWRCPLYTGNGGLSNWGLSFDISTGNTAWFGIGTGQATGSTALNATDRWYLVVLRKASGTVAPLSSVWNSSTNTWSHQTLTAFANGTVPTVNQAVMGSFQGSDFFHGDIAAVLCARGWAPNDATVEGLGLEDLASNWETAAGFATAGAALWIPGDTPTSTPLVDLTGGGADQSGITGTTVSSDPVGWYDLGGGGAIVDLDDLVAAGMGVGSTAIARLAPIRELEPVAAGMGVGAAAIARLTPIKELEPSAAGMGVGSAPVARLHLVKELDPVAAGMGAAAASLGVSLTKELDLAPAGMGVAASEATMAPYRGLLAAPAGLGVGAAPVDALRLVVALVPAPAGMGVATAPITEILETLDLVLLDDLAPAGLGLGASTASLGVLRSLELEAAGMGAGAAPVPSLAPIRDLLVEAAGMGVGASEALVGVTRSLELAPAGLGVGAEPVDALLRTLNLALAPAGLGVAAAPVPVLNLGEARASWRTYAIVEEATGNTVAVLLAHPYTQAATVAAETGASNSE